MAANNANNANNSESVPFWEFVQALAGPNQGAGEPGEGVDHTQSQQFPGGFPFGPGDFAGWGGPGAWGHWGGPWGRRGRWEGPWGPWGGRRPRGPPGPDNDAPPNDDEDGSPDTVRDGPGGDEPHPPPPPPFGFGPHPHPGHGGPGHRGFGRRGRGCGRGRGGFRGPHGRHGGPPPHCPAGFNVHPMMQAFARHPFAQALRQYLEQNAPEVGDGDETFTPPIDIFNRPTEWQLHVAIPGAKKDDIGVNWDAEKNTLNVAGVVYRPGDEEFLQSLSTSERKVGMFDRNVQLPPAGSDEKDEVDSEHISAKLEDGVLIVTVPKVEREWTEVKKVDIE